VLKKYDQNGDGTFAETELGTEYVLTLGLGRSELRRSTGSMQMMNPARMSTGDAILPGTAGLSGPEWFRRMDRNQDGDVSPREFLGTPASFQEIDTDQDQLISASEAGAVQ
jgi:Ca2+-binding EF-hand superfamily protein